MTLSVCLATYNEGKNLEECLNSVKDIADEIIIVDGNSTDGTREIAKRSKAQVISSVNHPIFHIQKQMAVEKASSDWILVLDADERITPELSREIKKVIDSNTEISGYWIKRKKKFMGRWITKGGQYPDPVIRLFKKGAGKHPQKSVHEQIEIEGKVGWLNSELIHLPTPSFSTYITKDNRYSTLFAQELLNSDSGTDFFNFTKLFIIRPISTFLTIYIRHKGFADGFPGFIFAFYSGLTYASAYVKYWEFKHNPTLSSRADQDWT